MNGGEHRCLDQSRVAQGHEVVVAVDQVEFGGVFKHFGDVEVFTYFGIDGGIFFISLIDDGVQAGSLVRLGGTSLVAFAGSDGTDGLHPMHDLISFGAIPLFNNSIP